NRLGQSQATPFGHHLEIYQERFQSFGWRTETIEGHDIEEILEVLAAVGLGDQPLVILARTLKGGGVSFLQDKEGWHGKPLSKEESVRAIAELQPSARSAAGQPIAAPSPLPAPRNAAPAAYPPTAYAKGLKVATREAYGNALVRIGGVDPRVVALDGDTKNSTFSEKFARQFPDRFTECFIAEQNMVGIATGFAARSKIPFASTFAAFLTRACDQIRIAGISGTNLKLAGSHAGVSIGEDGPSQMGLEDLAILRAVPGAVVLYPCDAVSTEKLVEQMTAHQGLCYLRTSRPKTPVIYDNAEPFPIGGAKILQQSDHDKVTVVAAGVTVFEALQAADVLRPCGIHVTVIDAYSVKPLAVDLIKAAAARTNLLVVTVEDHYPEGGLGDAVAAALSPDGYRVHKLAVREVPRSGKSEELLARYGIDAHGIVEKIRSLVSP
ncbi:MAG TPA: transketolase, partial [Verrucomicrobiota bacterium]|nr:transketolase [Verrucomicrobiota bacterium]